VRKKAGIRIVNGVKKRSRLVEKGIKKKKEMLNRDQGRRGPLLPYFWGAEGKMEIAWSRGRPGEGQSRDAGKNGREYRGG